MNVRDIYESIMSLFSHKETDAREEKDSVFIEEEKELRHLRFRRFSSGQENVFWHLPLAAFLFFIL